MRRLLRCWWAATVAGARAFAEAWPVAFNAALDGCDAPVAVTLPTVRAVSLPPPAPPRSHAPTGVLPASARTAGSEPLVVAGLLTLCGRSLRREQAEVYARAACRANPGADASTLMLAALAEITRGKSAGNITG